MEKLSIYVSTIADRKLRNKKTVEKRLQEKVGKLRRSLTDRKKKHRH